MLTSIFSLISDALYPLFLSASSSHVNPPKFYFSKTSPKDQKLFQFVHLLSFQFTFFNSQFSSFFKLCALNKMKRQKRVNKHNILTCSAIWWGANREAEPSTLAPIWAAWNFPVEALMVMSGEKCGLIVLEKWGNLECELLGILGKGNTEWAKSFSIQGRSDLKQESYDPMWLHKSPPKQVRGTS